MKNSLVITSRNLFVFKDRSLLFSFIIIASGLVFGVINYIISFNSIENQLYNFFIDFNTFFADKTYSEIFFGFALSGLFYFFSMFIIGGSIFGKVLCSIVTFIKATGISLIISYLYCNFGLRGFEYALLVFFPGKIILLFSMLFMTKTCIENCDMLTDSDVSDSLKIKNYALKSIVVFIFLFISWSVDLLCIFVFSGLFDFS